MNLDTFITLIFTVITIIGLVAHRYDKGISVLKYQKQVAE